MILNRRTSGLSQARPKADDFQDVKFEEGSDFEDRGSQPEENEDKSDSRNGSDRDSGSGESSGIDGDFRPYEDWDGFGNEPDMNEGDSTLICIFFLNDLSIDPKSSPLRQFKQDIF